ncbi:serpin family protein [Pedobacter insulae]|uniref:Serpin B n=1 Tax=Pedobacter insulae TaxID=414048 RepID=A0A1I2WPE5_9SPHI|nr:serpin family protein [Pedobacter insulae]SFH03125.1 serpin B [Pedobacter insulae]
MKKTYALFVLIAFVICLTSCKKDRPKDKFSVLNLTAKELQKAEADNKFTFNMLKQVAAAETAGKNLMVSPLSVSIALGMTSNGSNGQTLTDIRNAMQFKDFTEAEVNSYYQKIIKSLPELDSRAKLHIANSIWYRNDFAVLPSFLETNQSNYNAKVSALDFASPTAKNTINSWVNDQTQGKIPTIINEISSNMVMYLINAVYFKSAWKNPFDKSKTAKANFKLADGNMVQADFMYSDRMDLRGTADQNAAIFELPYGNDIYSMVLVLPKAGMHLDEVIENLDANKWKTWMSGLTNMSPSVKIPKFKFSYEKTLNETLAGLGMSNAFSNNADFTRINANGGLKISEVKHKTFLDVNEEGTEAAAVTSVGITFTSVQQAVLIDRPFMFAIRERHTGLILFTGLVNNPTLTN